MDLTTCPACGATAEVLWRESWPSTDGPVEHAKVECLRRHWFLLPVSHQRAGKAGGLGADRARLTTGVGRADAGPALSCQ